jgi:hypothetical protein
MAILTLLQISDLANYSGRPESSYTSFGNSAILQATILFQTVTEMQPSDQAALSPEDGQLADFGILAMADYLYLRQPYQAPIASPFMSERIGSYSYQKAEQEVARNAAALEVTGEATGVFMYDTAVRFLAKRTRAGGVFSGSIGVFDQKPEAPDQIEIRWHHGRMVILGPADMNKYDFPFGGINAPSFPQDPGI